MQMDADILEEFKLALGENNKHEPYLTKVFKQKIKRSKKKVNADDSSESESDLSMSDEDEEVKKEEITPEVCPSDCPADLWSAVLQFRENRLDIEDELADIQKFVDVIIFIFSSF